MSPEVPWKLETGDCLAALREMPAASVETVVTDPPYGLKFLAKAWDAGLPDPAVWAECLRVAKPGAFLFAFGGTRTFHRLACHIEDSGWILKDCLCWLYSKGFPVSTNIAKAIDKRRDDGGKGPSEEWLSRPVFEGQPRTKAVHRGAAGYNGRASRGGSAVKPAAKAWEGWGTALAPGWEPVLCAMKPVAGTYAANALAHGVAGFHIDGARSEAGRWPRNVAMDAATRNELPPGARRAFYCPKAETLGSRGANNEHPTVKPLELMRWLCRLSETPTGGTVLDPFAGSGSTGVAALLEGRRFIGMELDEAHALTARERLEEAARRFRLLERARALKTGVPNDARP